MRAPRTGVLCLLAIAGCEKQDLLYCEEHANDVEHCAPIDGAGEDLDAFEGVCLGPGGAFELCIAEPASAVTLTGMIDTGSYAGCQAPVPSWTDEQPDACIITGTSIATTGDVTVIGVRPLVLVATGAIQIEHALDASSRRGDRTGPGARGCEGGTPPVGDPGGGGGGAGGSFGTRGGDGGAGAVAGGTAGDAVMPAQLLGGCAGQQGGGVQGGIAGGGGGAIYLLAGTSITFTATGSINASGAGSEKPEARGGGGGGGSGGMIALHAPVIATLMDTKIYANGGGGSSGSGNGSGRDGEDANADPTVRAQGGAGGGGNEGGEGGDGYAIGNPAGPGVMDLATEGGGGGGGGGGYIRSNQPLGEAIVSPPVVMAP